MSGWYDGLLQWLSPEEAKPRPLGIRERFCSDVEHYLPLVNSKGETLDQFLHTRPNFFPELLLLRVNRTWLAKYLRDMPPEIFVSLRKRVQFLFDQLSTFMEDTSPIRKAHAFEVMAVFSKFLSESSSCREAQFGLSAFDFMTSDRDVQSFFETISFRMCMIFEETEPVSAVTEAAMKLLVTLCCHTENIDQNPFVPFLLQTQRVFDAIIGVLAWYNNDVVANSRGIVDATFVVCVLVSYRKFELPSVALQRAEVIDGSEAVSGMYCGLSSEVKKSLSRHFEYMGEKSIIDVLAEKVSGAGHPEQVWSGWGSLNRRERYTVLVSCLATYHLSYLNKKSYRALVATQENLTEVVLVRQLPVLLSVLSLCALNPKDPMSISVSRLLLLMLRVLAEDEQGSSLLHSCPSTALEDVFIATREEGGKIKRRPFAMNVPLVNSIFALFCEYIRSNLKKNFDTETYGKLYDVMHRLLCYQLSQDTKSGIGWRSVIQVFMLNLAFVSADDVFNVEGVPLVASKIVNLMNVLITYPDLFANESDYDFLYYEIVRRKDTIERLIVLAEKNKSNRMVMVLNPVSLGNLKAISVHFSNCIMSWQSANNGVDPTPEQIMNIIQNGYSSLQLKLQEQLDRFDIYAETSGESNLLKHIIRECVGCASEKV